MVTRDVITLHEMECDNKRCVDMHEMKCINGKSEY